MQLAVEREQTGAMMTLLFDTSHVYDMIRFYLLCVSMIMLWICV